MTSSPLRPLLAAILAAILAACGGAALAQPAPPQLWFHLMPYTESQVDGRQGWDRLFAPGAVWPAGMERVQVVSMASDWFATANFPPNHVMRAAAARLRQDGIAFATISLAQSWVGEPACGQGVEGYTDPPGNARLAHKLKMFGFDLAYVVMDEPLWYGHYYAGPNACASTIDNVAERAAAIVREYVARFPAVVIGENEPVSLASQSGWQADYQAWQAAFAHAMGRPIAFLRADVQWNNPAWPSELAAMLAFSRAEHLPVGIIYNTFRPSNEPYTPPVLGTSTTPYQESVNAQWMSAALANIAAIEQANGAPDQAIFQSWGPLPIRSLSTAPSRRYPAGKLGEDYLVQQYLLSHGGI